MSNSNFQEFPTYILETFVDKCLKDDHESKLLEKENIFLT